MVNAVPLPARGEKGVRGAGGLAHTRKIGLLGGAVARVFPNVSLAMCTKNSLCPPPYSLDSGAGMEST